MLIAANALLFQQSYALLFQQSYALLFQQSYALLFQQSYALLFQQCYALPFQQSYSLWCHSSFALLRSVQRNRPGLISCKKVRKYCCFIIHVLVLLKIIVFSEVNIYSNAP